MTDILIPKKNVILDATLLNGLMSCPLYLDFRYNKQLVSLTGKSNSLEVGSIIHKVLEEFYKHIIKRFPRDTAIAQAMMAGELYIRGCQYCSDFQPTEEIPTPTCKHQPNEYPGVSNTPAENTTNPNRTGWKWALETCEQYFEHYKSDFWTPLETEVVKKKILYEDDEIRVLWKAKLDLVTDTYNGVFPVDHKSMKQRREKSSLNNQFIGQCLICDTRSVIINKVGLQLSLKPEEKFTREPISYSAARLIEWQSVTLPYYAYKYIQYVEQGFWPQNFTHCENVYGNCAFKKVCESDPEMREEELKLQFKVGPKWDPVNVEEGE